MKLPSWVKTSMYRSLPMLGTWYHHSNCSFYSAWISEWYIPGKYQVYTYHVSAAAILLAFLVSQASLDVSDLEFLQILSVLASSGYWKCSDSRLGPAKVPQPVVDLIDMAALAWCRALAVSTSDSIRLHHPPCQANAHWDRNLRASRRPLLNWWSLDKSLTESFHSLLSILHSNDFKPTQQQVNQQWCCWDLQQGAGCTVMSPGQPCRSYRATCQRWVTLYDVNVNYGTHMTRLCLVYDWHITKILTGYVKNRTHIL